MLAGNAVKVDLIIGVLILFLLALMTYNHWRAAFPPANHTEGLGVKDLIEKVKAELVETEQNQARSNEAPVFALQDFDLEINFVVGTRQSAKGTLEPYVVTVGSETEISSERIQKIRLRMTAIPPMLSTKSASPSPVSEPQDAIRMNPPQVTKGEKP